MEFFCRSSSCKKAFGIGADGLLQIGMELLEFGRVNVHSDLVCFAREILRAHTL